MDWDQIRVSAVRSRQPTAWSTEQPSENSVWLLWSADMSLMLILLTRWLHLTWLLNMSSSKLLTHQLEFFMQKLSDKGDLFRLTDWKV